MYPHQTQTHLAEWLPKSASKSVKEAIVGLLRETSSPNDAEVAAIVDDLTEPEIALGARDFMDPSKPWRRKMKIGSDDYSGVRQGLYPGQEYTHSYGRYRLEVASGLRLVAVGANGGYMNDAMFLVLEERWIYVKAADDQHRDRLIAEIEDHIERANVIVRSWNETDLPSAVQHELKRQQQERAALDQRTASLEGAGFTPATKAGPQPVPLRDTKPPRRAPRRSSPAAFPDGDTYVVTADQFERVLECVATHRENVERLRGAGAAPSAGEDDHRDALLLSLNIRFENGTAESFSKTGKTDIRLSVDGHGILFFECKIWAGPASVDGALEQLLTKYLTYRDRRAVMVLFVRNRANPSLIQPKAFTHIQNAHKGLRVDNVAGFPVMRIPVPKGDGRVVDVAVVVIVVDSAAPRS